MKELLDMMKRWFWYDWFMLGLRLLISFSLLFTIVQFQSSLTLPLWIVITWMILSFSIPWLGLQLHYRYYLVTEMFLFGGLTLYLSHLFPEAYVVFLMPSFMIAANSAERSYRWSAPVAIVLVPSLIIMGSQQLTPWLTMIHMGLAYGIGISFRLLVVNRKQHEMILRQNAVLEQYSAQVERITLLEERDRLAKDLHDTMGHSYTTILMGLETLRTELLHTPAAQKLDDLMHITRKSMDEVRAYLHQIEPTEASLPLHQAIEQLVEEFQEHAHVQVEFYKLGEAYSLPKQVNMTLYRCVQESLTNAVRHGQATSIKVTLQFEPQQTRLEISDNGAGTDDLQEGFGLKAMKERIGNMQGQLSVYSAREQGTVVTCTLPRQMEKSDEVIPIMLVDDEPFIRESLRMILEQATDIKVVGMAGDGMQALEICEQMNPQVVLMDLNMPQMDGIAALRQMKLTWPHIRVVILTTFQETERAHEALRSGADGYLLKSMEPRELLETIRLIHRGGMMIDHDLSSKLFRELETPESQSSAAKLYELTPREIEILQLITKGMRYKSIASALYLSDGTVRNYASTIYAKLGVRNREEATLKAVELELFA